MIPTKMSNFIDIVKFTVIFTPSLIHLKVDPVKSRNARAKSANRVAGLSSELSTSCPCLSGNGVDLGLKLVFVDIQSVDCRTA